MVKRTQTIRQQIATFLLLIVRLALKWLKPMFEIKIPHKRFYPDKNDAFLF